MSTYLFSNNTITCKDNELQPISTDFKQKSSNINYQIKSDLLHFIHSVAIVLFSLWVPYIVVSPTFEYPSPVNANDSLIDQILL